MNWENYKVDTNRGVFMIKFSVNLRLEVNLKTNDITFFRETEAHDKTEGNITDLSFEERTALQETLENLQKHRDSIDKNVKQALKVLNTNYDENGDLIKMQEAVDSSPVMNAEEEETFFKIKELD